MMKFTSIMVVLFAIALWFVNRNGLWFSNSEQKCSFKGMFSFGDGYSDTGVTCAVEPQVSPNGMTYFGKPVGRYSDGRVYIDFLAQALGLPFLNPYLNSVLTEFTNGVNFAVNRAPVLMSSTDSRDSPYYLKAQLDQLELFMRRVVELEPRFGRINLPKSDIFGNSLYVFYIGQTDFTTNLPIVGVEGVKQYFPDVVSTISSSVEQIYGLGGRTILVMNLAPIGCYPKYLVEFPYGSSDLDAYGCSIPINNAVQEYNKMLKETVSQTRQELVGATVVIVDIYSILLDMFRHPESHGLKYGTKACCGYGGGPYNYNPEVFCGYSKVINEKTAVATACDDPHEYVSWDGVHFTEAANKILASAILNGSFSDPPFPFHHFCDLHPIF